MGLLCVLVLVLGVAWGSRRSSSKSQRGRFREQRAERLQNGVDGVRRSPNADEEEGEGQPEGLARALLSLDPNEGAAAYDCCDLASVYGIEVGERILPGSSSVFFMGFDDLFPKTGFGDLFDEDARFRSAIRMAARQDFSSRDGHELKKRFKRHDSGKDSVMKFWLDEGKNRNGITFPELTKVFEKFLPHSGLQGDDFMSTLMGLCGENPQFGSWMDIIGVVDKKMVHAWHQDSGYSHKTVMVGFPSSNRYEGIGVFSHAVKLSNRLLEPGNMNEADATTTIPGPRTWPLEEMLAMEGSGRGGEGNRRKLFGPVAAESVLQFQFFENNIIRPLYKKGKEIMIYDDSLVFHSAPDFIRRESLWRFM